MVQPGFEAPDDESWGGISRPSPAMSITRGPKPAAGRPCGRCPNAPARTGFCCASTAEDSPGPARTIARLQVAVGRGLLPDVLATGDGNEVDTARQYFAGMLRAHLAGSEVSGSAPRRGDGSPG